MAVELRRSGHFAELRRAGRGTGARGLTTGTPEPFQPSNLPPGLRRLTRDEYEGANFAGMTKTIAGFLDSVEASVPRSAFENAVRRGQGLLDREVAGEGADAVRLRDAFPQLRRAFEESDRTIASAIAEGEARLAEVATPDPQLVASLEHFRRVRPEGEGRYVRAVEDVEDSLLGGVRDVSVGLANALGKLSPGVRADMLERIARGGTKLADDVADVLAAAGRPLRDRMLRMGLDSFAPRERQRQRQVLQLIESRLDQAGDRARFVNVTLGMDARQIEAAFAGALTGDSARCGVPPTATATASDTLKPRACRSRRGN